MKMVANLKSHGAVYSKLCNWNRITSSNENLNEWFYWIYKTILLGYGKRDTSYYGYNHVDHGYHGYQDTCPGNCGTVEDCFDLPCPRYGARVRFRYTIPRNANLSQNYGQLTERQTGEGFRSRAPPDCRVVAG